MSERLVVWWNLQRLLRPGGSPLGRALGVTAAEGWTAAAYRRKVAILGALLREVCDGEQPLILALGETEDEQAAADVAGAAGLSLRAAEDPDARLIGDDLVLLYDGDALALDGPPASYNVHNRYTTRDVFEVPFRTAGGAPLVVVSNHWPSRRLSNSEPLRIGLADYCRRLVERRLKFGKDELVTRDGRPRLPAAAAMRERAETPVIVLGDFNDDPFDTSVQSVLGATRSRARASAPLRLPRGKGRGALDDYLSLTLPLYNPSWSRLIASEGASGTVFWNGAWYMLDQVVVSRGLIGDGPVRFVDDSLRVPVIASVDLPGEPGVQVTTRSGVPLPYDPKTGRGASDHLPLAFRVEIA